MQGELKMFNQMNKYNTCIFSTSDDSDYAFQCISRLELASKIAGGCSTFLIGSHFNQAIKVIAKAKNINLIEVGEKNGYFEKEWEYPRECYYWALAPLYLPQTYGIYIDGDVYCRKNPFLDLNKYPVESISGLGTSKNPGVTKEEVNLYRKHFNYRFTRKRIQSGVLYLNLEYLRNNKFTEDFSFLYKWSIENGIPRKGDDSLLYIFIKTHSYPYGYLPMTYNWLRTSFGDPQEDVVWYHAKVPHQERLESLKK